MNTRHLSNFTLPSLIVYIKPIGYLLALFIVVFLVYSEYRKPVFVTFLLICTTVISIYYFALRSHVMFTLTATHLQQHFFKGGWVVKWDNIQNISMCTIQQDGWHEPLPWIGIKLKHYQPYLDSICPKVACEILLNQRGLLYVGAKQAGKQDKFEDIVLDSKHCIIEKNTGDGKNRILENIDNTTSNHSTRDKPIIYTGMQAMLGNRMRYQRNYHGYDIFIATNEISMSGEEFVGLARRYLAAAEHHDSADSNE